MSKKLVRTILLILAGFLAINLLFYLFQPMRFGFSREELRDEEGKIFAVIYTDKAISDRIPLEMIQANLEETESLYGLTFNRKIKLFICRDHVKSRWLVPWFRGKVSAFALGEQVIVIQWDHMLRLNYSMEDVLIHESSHLLMQQNSSSLANKMRFVSQDHSWVREGLAVWTQDFYILPFEEMREGISPRNWESFMEENRNIPGNHRFFYHFYGYLFKYLDEQYGREKIQQWITLYLEDPVQKEQWIRQIYGKDLNELLMDLYCREAVQ